MESSSSHPGASNLEDSCDITKAFTPLYWGEHGGIGFGKAETIIRGGDVGEMLQRFTNGELDFAQAWQCAKLCLVKVRQLSPAEGDKFLHAALPTSADPALLFVPPRLDAPGIDNEATEWVIGEKVLQEKKNLVTSLAARKAHAAQLVLLKDQLIARPLRQRWLARNIGKFGSLIDSESVAVSKNALHSLVAAPVRGAILHECQDESCADYQARQRVQPSSALTSHDHHNALAARMSAPSPSPSLISLASLSAFPPAKKMAVEAPTDTENMAVEAPTDTENMAVEAPTDTEDDRVCDLCLSPISQEDNPIVFCDGPCGGAMHHECYGVPNAAITSDDPWYCVACKAIISYDNGYPCRPDKCPEMKETLTYQRALEIARELKPPLRCCLCPSTDLAGLRQITAPPQGQGYWVHLQCAWWSDGAITIDFGQPGRESCGPHADIPPRIDVSGLPRVPISVRCNLCDQKFCSIYRPWEHLGAGIWEGISVPCQVEACNKRLHPYCAFKAGLAVMASREGEPMSFDVYCINHKSKATKIMASEAETPLELLPQGCEFPILTPPSELPSSFPWLSNVTLKQHQVKGLSFLLSLYGRGLSGFVCDAFGTGKTLQVIAMLLYLKYEAPPGHTGPHLVIVPDYELSQWRCQFHRYAGDKLSVYALSSTDKSKLSEQSVLEYLDSQVFPANPDVLVVTYKLFIEESQWFLTHRWRVAVVDELLLWAGTDGNTIWDRGVCGLHCLCRIMLSSIPIETNLRGALCLLAATYPETFHTPAARKIFQTLEDAVRSRTGLSRVPGQASVSNGSSDLIAEQPIVLSQAEFEVRERALKVLLSQVRIRRLKITESECTPPTPNTYVVHCPMTDLQKVKYSQKLQSLAKEPNLHKAVLTMIKMSSHPALCGDTSTRAISGELSLSEQLESCSGKLQYLKILLQAFSKLGKKIVIFSVFSVNLLSRWLGSVNLDFYLITASAPDLLCHLLADEFSSSSNPVPILIVEIPTHHRCWKATGAACAIYFDTEFNLEAELECRCVLEDFGETAVRDIVHLVSADSVESNLRGLLALRYQQVSRLLRTIRGHERADRDLRALRILSVLFCESNLVQAMRERPSVMSQVDKLDLAYLYHHVNIHEVMQQSLLPCASAVFDDRFHMFNYVANSHELSFSRKQDRIMPREFGSCGICSSAPTFLNCRPRSGILQKCSICPQQYHAHCLANIRQLRCGTFTCPLHQCISCDRRSPVDGINFLYVCQSCPSAYCSEHIKDHPYTLSPYPNVQHSSHFDSMQMEVAWINCWCCLHAQRSGGLRPDTDPWWAWLGRTFRPDEIKEVVEKRYVQTSHEWAQAKLEYNVHFGHSGPSKDHWLAPNDLDAPSALISVPLYDKKWRISVILAARWLMLHQSDPADYVKKFACDPRYEPWVGAFDESSTSSRPVSGEYAEDALQDARRLLLE